MAIARALVTRPEVVFADEPTGALDTRSGREVLGLLRQVVDELGQTVVMVTTTRWLPPTPTGSCSLPTAAWWDELTGPTAERIADG